MRRKMLLEAFFVVVFYSLSRNKLKDYAIR